MRIKVIWFILVWLAYTHGHIHKPISLHIRCIYTHTEHRLSPSRCSVEHKHSHASHVTEGYGSGRRPHSLLLGKLIGSSQRSTPRFPQWLIGMLGSTALVPYGSGESTPLLERRDDGMKKRVCSLLVFLHWCKH